MAELWGGAAWLRPAGGGVAPPCRGWRGYALAGQGKLGDCGAASQSVATQGRSYALVGLCPGCAHAYSRAAAAKRMRASQGHSPRGATDI